MKSTISLAITLGDPGGIGAEVALKAACQKTWPGSLRLVLIGSRYVLQKQARQLKLNLPPAWTPGTDKIIPHQIVNWDPAVKNRRKSTFLSWNPGITGKRQAQSAAQWIRKAVSGCQAGWFNGMVTGPICKKSFQLADIPFPGHTEFLAFLTHSQRYAMMLLGGKLHVVLVTRHLPLADVPATLTKNSIIQTVRLAAEAVNWLKLKNKTIGVCALNPHAGDHGLLGREELTIILPAIRQLHRLNIPVVGPVCADVIFHKALHNQYGVIIAMYHDQALAPLKMLAFESGVNLTLGLPIIRTSPDHGTAFDIAGKMSANPNSMINAIRLCATLARRQNPWHI